VNTSLLEAEPQHEAKPTVPQSATTRKPPLPALTGIRTLLAIFIILLVRDELSYDTWLPGTKNLYRIELAFHVPDQPSMRTNNAAFPMPDAMLAQIPEVKTAVHLEPRQMTVATGDRQFLDHVDVVSTNFFQKVQIRLVAGNPATVFAQPESAVITESMAKKYFGGAPAVGKTLHIVGGCQYGPEIEGCNVRQADVLVTGVARDLPHNTQLSGDVFIPNTSAADPMSPNSGGFRQPSTIGLVAGLLKR